MSGKEKTNTASSPFLNAKQEWLEQFGSVAKNAAHWRMFALLLVVLLLLSVSGNIYQGLQNKIVPYIVAVDKVAGKAAAISRADVAGETPRRLIQANIAEVIHNWRTVTPDLELQQGLVNKLSAYLAGSARGAVKSWLEENNPFTRAEKSIVSVEIKGLPLPVSAESWRVEWTETVRNHAGITQSSTAFEATVSVAITPPVSDAQIIANPGGVFVTGISFSKLLGQ
ncbi:MAG: type IV secretion system protein [Desulfovibrio sp.]|jgi:type IV secretion system protein VirB5|nr:type IV secretion system protein [Desulfovibrio sp.]